MSLRMNKIAAVIIAVTLASPGHGQNPGTPPGDGGDVWILDPADPSVGTSACSFPVEVDFAGKIKDFSLPGGRTMLTAPGLSATIINLSDPSKQVELGVTGSLKFFSQPDGGTVVIATGRNLLTDASYGLTLTIGIVSFAFDSAGNLTQGLTVKAGQTVSVCSLID